MTIRNTVATILLGIVAFSFSIKPLSGRTRRSTDNNAPHHTQSKRSKNKPDVLFSAQYPGRVDDVVLENEYSIYRIYGPASERRGDHCYGYDVFVKNTREPVAAGFYASELRSYAIMDSLRAAGKKDSADAFNRTEYPRYSYHYNHGQGMDVYRVGRTLGCGTNAIYLGGQIIMPYCYRDYEVVYDTPDSLQIHLTFAPKTYTIGDDTLRWTEHRLLTVERGVRWVRCEVWYDGLDREVEVVAGIVMNKGADGQANEPQYGYNYIAYEDPTDPHSFKQAGKGSIMIGVVNPRQKVMRVQDDHLLSVSDLAPGQRFRYWFASGWSLGGEVGVEGINRWRSICYTFVRKHLTD